jgi:AcrR family transcriptional regulator
MTVTRKTEAPENKALQKGQQTKAAIVDAALGLATQIGLEGLSIGALAEVARMSKSGVFAHFGSREELQISVVREYHARFEAEVFMPILQPRLSLFFLDHFSKTLPVSGTDKKTKQPQLQQYQTGSKAYCGLIDEFF